MFARMKTSGGGDDLQIVESYRDGGTPKHRMVLYVGHYDSLADALKQMPRDRQQWRSRATRRDDESARRIAESIDGRLRALQALVEEHPELLERDRARAERRAKKREAEWRERLERRARAGSDQQTGAWLT